MKLNWIFVPLSIFVYLLPISSASPAETLPTLPKTVRENHFKQADMDFKTRWQKYEKGKNFVAWTKGRTEDSIVKEFDHLDAQRRSAWFEEPYADVLVANPDYQVAQVLLAKGLYRNLNTLGFEYNKTDDSFNSNTVVVGKHRFLALEEALKLSMYLRSLICLCNLTPCHALGSSNTSL